MSPERVLFGFTGSERLREKIQRIRQIPWHTNPAGRLELLVEALADFYLARRDPGRKKRQRPLGRGR
ncbi:MAG: hypothetical protein HY928_02890 [Elusimicrobia bacterium]|nr:hypothetical protein [Elusimicrobiota bacterium]